MKYVIFEKNKDNFKKVFSSPIRQKTDLKLEELKQSNPNAEYKTGYKWFSV